MRSAIVSSNWYYKLSMLEIFSWFLMGVWALIPMIYCFKYNKKFWRMEEETA